MSSIARARCPECGEPDNIYIIDETRGNRRDRSFERVWFECQECEHVFVVTEWDEPPVMEGETDDKA